MLAGVWNLPIVVCCLLHVVWSLLVVVCCVVVVGRDLLSVSYCVLLFVVVMCRLLFCVVYCLLVCCVGCLSFVVRRVVSVVRYLRHAVRVRRFLFDVCRLSFGGLC